MESINRRNAIKNLAVIGAGAIAASCSNTNSEGDKKMADQAGIPNIPAIHSSSPLGFVWDTEDPFLFCVHHDDKYPVGNSEMGPAASLAGRNIGNDFTPKDGWRMYHGEIVPGFPQHPHRGFETVTVVRKGLLDHSDSLGAAARYGDGDVQWLTAGKGIIHAEMFPLLREDQPNPFELFQIWLNLPSHNKMVDPNFLMLWKESIPQIELKDHAGKDINLTLVSGAYQHHNVPAPPPNSWAADSDAQLAIWSIKLSPHASFTLPATPKQVIRNLYFFLGDKIAIDAKKYEAGVRLKLNEGIPVTINNGAQASELLLLQGKPIGEPVVQHGPFVMNTREEIQQAFNDYQRTGFGGWPWHRNDPVHPRTDGRFARRPNGQIEYPA